MGRREASRRARFRHRPRLGHWMDSGCPIALPRAAGAQPPTAKLGGLVQTPARACRRRRLVQAGTEGSWAARATRGPANQPSPSDSLAAAVGGRSGLSVGFAETQLIRN
jgi:hypothetical protein